MNKNMADMDSQATQPYDVFDELLAEQLPVHLKPRIVEPGFSAEEWSRTMQDKEDKKARRGGVDLRPKGNGDDEKFELSFVRQRITWGSRRKLQKIQDQELRIVELEAKVSEMENTIAKLRQSSAPPVPEVKSPYFAGTEPAGKPIPSVLTRLKRSMERRMKAKKQMLGKRKVDVTMDEKINCSICKQPARFALKIQKKPEMTVIPVECTSEGCDGIYHVDCALNNKLLCMQIVEQWVEFKCLKCIETSGCEEKYVMMLHDYGKRQLQLIQEQFPLEDGIEDSDKDGDYDV